MKISRALVALYAVVVLSATSIAFSNYRAIEQHLPYDYPFYMRFYAKIYNPALNNDMFSYTNLCMRGHNAFFFGCDAAAGLNHSLHFDPIKYIVALVYLPFQSSVVLSIFYILIFYSPVLYAAWLIYKKHVGDEKILALSMAAYSLYPASFVVVNDGLRLMTFLFPFLILLILAILYRRSKTEHFLFLNLLLITREEGIVIALVLIGFLFLREKLEKVGNLSLKLLINTLAWIIPTGIYFKWLSASYSHSGTVASGGVEVAKLGHTAQKLVALIQHHPIFTCIGILVILGFIGYAFWRSYHKDLILWVTQTSLGRATAIIVGPITVTVIFLILGWTAFPWTSIFIFNRIGFFVAVFTMLEILFCMEIFARGDAHIRERKVWNIILSCSIVLFIAVQLFGTHSLIKLHTSNYAKESDAKLVFEAHKIVDPTNTLVLGDEKTSRVFYDANHFVVYNGLPSSVTSTSSRAFAQSLFTNTYGGKTYIIALRDDALALSKLAKQVPLRLTTLAENKTYMFILCQK